MLNVKLSAIFVSESVRMEVIMKSDSKIWRNTMFFRLFLTFLFIMIPIYIITMNIYQCGLNALKEQITKSMESQVNYYTSSLESEIGKIQSSLIELTYDSDLQDLSSDPDILQRYDKVHEINQLQFRLNQISYSNRLIEHVGVYIPLLGKSINNSLGVDPLDISDYDKLVQTNSKFFSTIYKADDGVYLTFRSRFNITGTKRPYYIILVKFDTNLMKDTMSQLDEDGNVLLLIRNQSNKYDYLSNDRTTINNNIMTFVSNKLPSKTSDISSMNTGSESYFVIY